MTSWHVPTIYKFGRSQDQCLCVVFLQRMQVEEREEVIEKLGQVDNTWISRANIELPLPPQRTLWAHPWLRDNPASPTAVLEIAKWAFYKRFRDDLSLHSLIFVDSLYSDGLVIAARWENTSERDDSHLSAVRVPVGAAGSLLDICDAQEGRTLCQVLGQQLYNDLKIDFYRDQQPVRAKEEELPVVRLPPTMADFTLLSGAQPIVISLRHVEHPVAKTLAKAIGSAYGENANPELIQIHQWHVEDPSRLDLLCLFHSVRKTQINAGLAQSPLFFIDNILQGENGEPHIIAANISKNLLLVAPVKPENVISLWTMAMDPSLWEIATQAQERIFDDIWRCQLLKRGEILKQEYILDIFKNLNVNDLGKSVEYPPVFFLEPFDRDEERLIRKNLSAPDEFGAADNGKEFIYFGYLWPDSDKSTHSVDDLSRLLQTCDPCSPIYDPKSPLKLTEYPNHFIAVGREALDPECPKVAFGTRGRYCHQREHDNVDDSHGWEVGTVPACDVYNVFVNISLPNMAPEELLKDRRLAWMCDMNAYRQNEWREWHNQPLDADGLCPCDSGMCVRVDVI